MKTALITALFLIVCPQLAESSTAAVSDSPSTAANAAIQTTGASTTDGPQVSTLPRNDSSTDEIDNSRTNVTTTNAPSDNSTTTTATTTAAAAAQTTTVNADHTTAGATVNLPFAVLMATTLVLTAISYHNVQTTVADHRVC